MLIFLNKMSCSNTDLDWQSVSEQDFSFPFSKSSFQKANTCKNGSVLLSSQHHLSLTVPSQPVFAASPAAFSLQEVETAMQVVQTQGKLVFHYCFVNAEILNNLHTT